MQKFFKKLHEANLPIPGSSCQLRSNKIKTQKHNLRLERPTTFFPERVIPKDLTMAEDNDEQQFFPPECSVNDKTKAVKLLKRIRDEKISHRFQNSHSEFNCNACEEILRSKKFECKDCAIYFCGDCITSQILNASFAHLQHNIE